LVGRCTRRPRSIRGVPPGASPELAPIVAEEIIARAQLLSRHPKLGRPISTREEYRQIVMQVLGGTYVFQYRYDGNQIVVLRVFHGREAR
jgi:plasmid stabilization system protein ParE